jgi:integrase/recombinase XerC
MAHAKALSDTNFRALIALLEKESRDLARDRAMVLLSMKAGLRAIEIAGLTWAASAKTIRSSSSSGGGKPRTVPVNKERRTALQAFRAECRRTGDDDVLFKCRHAKPGEPLSANAVTAWFRDLYVRRLGWAATHRTPAAAPLRRKRRGRRRPSAARSAMFKTCSGTPA